MYPGFHVPNLGAMKLPGPVFALAFVAVGTAFPACTCGSSETAPSAPATATAPVQAASAQAPAASASGRRYHFSGKFNKPNRPLNERVQRIDGKVIDRDALKQGKGAAQPPSATP